MSHIYNVSGILLPEYRKFSARTRMSLSIVFGIPATTALSPCLLTSCIHIWDCKACSILLQSWVKHRQNTTLHIVIRLPFTYLIYNCFSLLSSITSNDLNLVHKQNPKMVHYCIIGDNLYPILIMLYF